MEVAVANISVPETATLFQQLHNVPVSKVTPETWERTKGCKPNIKPSRRQVLVDLDVVVAVRCKGTLEHNILAGLDGQFNRNRYGLPLAGDNNFLFDSIHLAEEDLLVNWYVPLGQEESPRPGTCRLPVWIDRTNSSKTDVKPFAPANSASIDPPETAWISLPEN